MNTNTDPTKRPGSGVPAAAAFEASGSSPPQVSETSENGLGKASHRIPRSPIPYMPGAHEHGPFLKAIPPMYRGAVANAFLKSVRAGVTNPETIARRVHDEAWRRAGWSREAGDPIRNWRDAVSEVLYTPECGGLDRDTREDAEDMARWALWWESLPCAERKRIKAERSRAYLNAIRIGGAK